jgi:hypothetical protein
MWYIRKEVKGKFVFLDRDGEWKEKPRFTSIEERSWFFESLVRFDLRRDALGYIRDTYPFSPVRIVAVNRVVDGVY